MTTPDPVIYNFRRLDERTTTSGQPTEEALVHLSAMGVRVVVNLGLHTHERALKDEAGVVAGLGMTYVHLPVEFKAPTEADFQAFCAVLQETRGETLHVHCIANYRVSAFFYRYRRDVLGLNEAAARKALLDVWTPDPVWSAFLGV